MKQHFMIMETELPLQGGNNYESFKFLVGAATITVGACAVAGKVRRDKQRQEELDEFLCPDIDEPIEKRFNQV